MTAKKSKSSMGWFILVGLILAAILLGLFFPHYRSAMVQYSWALGKEMLMILPAVLNLHKFKKLLTPEQAEIFYSIVSERFAGLRKNPGLGRMPMNQEEYK